MLCFPEGVKYMDYCIIMCRSLTYAQRAVRLLETRRIYASLTKAPQGVTPEGCSYGVRVRASFLERALKMLAEAGIRTGRIYRIGSAGEVVEVEK